MKNIVKFMMLNFIPKNRYGDKLFAFISFIYFHKRLPNNSSNFIDVLHNVKISGVLNDPTRCFISDKYLVKQFVSGILNSNYSVPTICLLNNENEVLNFVAPSDCIAKPCHSSGNVVFLKKGDRIKLDSVQSWFEENYYEVTREINYKNLKKRIIVEPILYGNENLSDYKFFFFDGKFLFLQVDVDRAEVHKRSFYNKEFEFLDFSTKYQISEPQVKPRNFVDMLCIAEKLAVNFDNIIRIDLYTNGEDIKVGEITNCHGSAREKVLPAGKEVILNEYI